MARAYCIAPSKTNCAARDAVREKSPPATAPFGIDSSAGTWISPAGLLCLKRQGRPLILRDPKGNEEDFCGFSDGSIVLAQDLLSLSSK